MNAPELMKAAEQIGKSLNITPKDAYRLIDVEFSIMTNKVKLDIIKLDEFIESKPDESMGEALSRIYGNPVRDYIQTLI